jgi:N-acetylglucosamine-6-sulfatase
LRAKLPETKILLLAMLPRTPLELDNKVHRSNAIIAKNGDDQHVFYLDMRSSFETAPGVEKPGLYVEGLHLTAKGYEVWYEAMEPLFKKLYE